MKKYASIDDIANNERFPFTKGQLRHHVAKRHENGLATSIRKIGRRIYIREDLLDIWMDSHIEETPIQKGVKMMDIKLEDLEFTSRTYNCLKALDVKTFEDLINLTKSDLMKTRNMGKKSLEEIEEKVLLNGYSLKEE